MKNSPVMEQLPSPPPPEPVEMENPVAEPKDLLSLDDPNPVASNFDEKKALALSIVSIGVNVFHILTTNQPATAAGSSLQNGTTGWELAPVTAPSSYESSTAAIKLKAGGHDKLTLDGLCSRSNLEKQPEPGLQSVGNFYFNRSCNATINTQPVSCLECNRSTRGCLDGSHDQSASGFHVAAASDDGDGPTTATVFESLRRSFWSRALRPGDAFSKLQSEH
ncbi:hypothetical protein Nepgr_020816 [Nepenthes gracilis]|uniref:Uncharacterized protein n=1 Tax=Nepenthes gracilis TaxID=150966 RepID=A0AAD3XWL8_NEPGR|nr:hypothetical protein Nepgr_020816 [Nepenthes gracilis]